ncbi:MAG: hypothetical protein ACYTFY_07620 [Planctomycetota bacterium]|jgi:hypothetical protein
MAEEINEIKKYWGPCAIQIFLNSGIVITEKDDGKRVSEMITAYMHYCQTGEQDIYQFNVRTMTGDLSYIFLDFKNVQTIIFKETRKKGRSK